MGFQETGRWILHRGKVYNRGDSWHKCIEQRKEDSERNKTGVLKRWSIWFQYVVSLQESPQGVPIAAKVLPGTPWEPQEPLQRQGWELLWMEHQRPFVHLEWLGSLAFASWKITIDNKEHSGWKNASVILASSDSLEFTNWKNNLQTKWHMKLIGPCLPNLR